MFSTGKPSIIQILAKNGAHKNPKPKYNKVIKPKAKVKKLICPNCKSKNSKRQSGSYINRKCSDCGHIFRDFSII
jgi:ribosomal protein L37AE/L43A